MNTAEARFKARLAEERLDWAGAADLWQFAVDHYPAHHAQSAIALADLQHLTAKVKGCRFMVEHEKRGPRCSDCNQLLEDTFHAGVFFHVSPCSKAVTA